MSKDDSKKDRETRIENFRRQIEETTGEEIISFGSEDCPLELEEKFLEYMLAFEQGEHSPLFDTLVNGNLTLPSPNELDDS